MLKVSQLYYTQYWYYNSIIDNYYIHPLICVYIYILYIYICTVYWYILLIYLYNIDISFWWLKNPQIVGGFSPNPPGLHHEFFEVTWPVAPPALRMPMDARRWTNHHGILCPCVWKLGGYPLNDLNAQMLTLFFGEGYYSLLGKLGRSIFRSTLQFPGLGARGQFQSSASLLRFFEHLFNGSKFDPCLCVFSFHLLLGWPIGKWWIPKLAN